MWLNTLVLSMVRCEVSSHGLSVKPLTLEPYSPEGFASVAGTFVRALRPCEVHCAM